MANTAPFYHVAGSVGAMNTSGTAPVAQALDSSGDKIGCVFIAPDDSQAITKIGVYCTALTGTSPTYRVVIEGYNATGGIPDGTDVGGGSPTATTFTAVAATYHEITLTNAFTPTEGTAYAAVLEYDSGTIDGSNTASFTRSSGVPAIQGSPYCVSDTAGTWAKVNGVIPAITPVYANAFVVPGCATIKSVTTYTIGSGSNPDQVGNLWTVADTVDCIGARVEGRFSTTTADWAVVLYDTDGTSVLNTVTVDGECTSGAGHNTFHYVFWEPVTVTAAGEYRVVVKPTTAGTIRVYRPVFASSAQRESFAGPLQATTKNDAAAWIDTAEDILSIIPILSDSIAAGGGGAPGNMQGGLQ